MKILVGLSKGKYLCVLCTYWWSEVQVEIVFSKIKCIILTHQKDIEEEVKPWYDTPIYFVAVK